MSIPSNLPPSPSYSPEPPRTGLLATLRALWNGLVHKVSELFYAIFPSLRTSANLPPSPPLDNRVSQHLPDSPPPGPIVPLPLRPVPQPSPPKPAAAASIPAQPSLPPANPAPTMQLSPPPPSAVPAPAPMAQRFPPPPKPNLPPPKPANPYAAQHAYSYSPNPPFQQPSLPTSLTIPARLLASPPPRLPDDSSSITPTSTSVASSVICTPPRPEAPAFNPEIHATDIDTLEQKQLQKEQQFQANQQKIQAAQKQEEAKITALKTGCLNWIAQNNFVSTLTRFAEGEDKSLAAAARTAQENLTQLRLSLEDASTQDVEGLVNRINDPINVFNSAVDAINAEKSAGLREKDSTRDAKYQEALVTLTPFLSDNYQKYLPKNNSNRFFGIRKNLFHEICTQYKTLSKKTSSHSDITKLIQDNIIQLASYAQDMIELPPVSSDLWKEQLTPEGQRQTRLLEDIITIIAEDMPKELNAAEHANQRSGTFAPVTASTITHLPLFNPADASKYTSTTSTITSPATVVRAPAPSAHTTTSTTSPSASLQKKTNFINSCNGWLPFAGTDFDELTNLKNQLNLATDSATIDALCITINKVVDNIERHRQSTASTSTARASAATTSTASASAISDASLNDPNNDCWVYINSTELPAILKAMEPFIGKANPLINDPYCKFKLNIEKLLSPQDFARFKGRRTPLQLDLFFWGSTIRGDRDNANASYSTRKGKNLSDNDIVIIVPTQNMATGSLQTAIEHGKNADRTIGIRVTDLSDSRQTILSDNKTDTTLKNLVFDANSLKDRLASMVAGSLNI
ncbi:MAG: hypothetical protein P4L16_04760 [Chlamydiales bacterium]|nr:hypothetical protein [Chlamydiales bacterium]